MSGRWWDEATCADPRIAPIFKQTIVFKRRVREDHVSPLERDALAICATCPVRRECLDDEMTRMRTGETNLTFGVIGGTVPHQRYTLLRSQRRAAS